VPGCGRRSSKVEGDESTTPAWAGVGPPLRPPAGCEGNAIDEESDVTDGMVRQEVMWRELRRPSRPRVPGRGRTDRPSATASTRLRLKLEEESRGNDEGRARGPGALVSETSSLLHAFPRERDRGPGSPPYAAPGGAEAGGHLVSLSQPWPIAMASASFGDGEGAGRLPLLRHLRTVSFRARHPTARGRSRIVFEGKPGRTEPFGPPSPPTL